jgi:hypothetical protein
VRATKKLLDRVGGSDLTDDTLPTTLLGQRCAIALMWRPQVVLLVDELTLLPVLMPLAPAPSLASRIGAQVAIGLTAHTALEHLVERSSCRQRQLPWHHQPAARGYEPRHKTPAPCPEAAINRLRALRECAKPLSLHLEAPVEVLHQVDRLFF